MPPSQGGDTGSIPVTRSIFKLLTLSLMDSPKLSNLAIARMLREIAAAYEVKGENRFKIRAYDTAADSVEHATSEIKDLWEEGRLAELPGVGEAISSHLDEYFRTGKVKHFQEVKKGLPQGLFEIFKLEGIGPKRAHKLAGELKIKDVEGLYKAAQQGRVAKLDGFGERSEKQILKAIERQRKEEGRMPLPTAFSIAEQLIEEISTFPGFVRADPLGSLRRMVETIGDVDLGVATKDPPETIARFLKLPGVGRVLAAGKAKVSVVMKTGHQVDLRVQDPESYGALLQYFTGSKAHNIHLRKIANSQGLSLSEYGISRYAQGRKAGPPDPIPTEEELYQRLGMPYIPPEIREDTGEIEAAQKGALPVLVKDGEIRGEVHVHTSNSPDGEVPAPEMVEEAVSLGREYVGISDHSPSVNTRGAEGARREIMKRKKEVEALRKKYRGKIEIFFGAETNIDSTGKMALPDELLELHDFVIASIHTSFDQSREQITRRIVNALENPYVNAIAHPTGRLLTKRSSYEADWDKIFETARSQEKPLEINAYPLRLDLPDELIRRARAEGVRFIISTDAHQKKHFGNLGFGAATARRGWCGKEDILNTRTAGDFARLFKVRR